MAEKTVDAWGRVIFSPEAMERLLLEGEDISNLLFEDSPKVQKYNSWCATFDKTEHVVQVPEAMTNTPEEEHARRASTWLVQDQMDAIPPVRDYVLSLCSTDAQRARVNEEMDLFEARGMEIILKLMIVTIEHFRRNKVVWGVGRGSSVASYVLYLIGVHKIDSMKYNLSVSEFLK